MLVADRFADRRVFLVGESAHVNPPWGGHGFNTSVGDAVNIAWKIGAVENGWAGPALLESYEPERRSVVEQTVASAEANMRAGAADYLAQLVILGDSELGKCADDGAGGAFELMRKLIDLYCFFRLGECHKTNLRCLCAA